MAEAEPGPVVDGPAGFGLHMDGCLERHLAVRRQTIERRKDWIYCLEVQEVQRPFQRGQEFCDGLGVDQRFAGPCSGYLARGLRRKFVQRRIDLVDLPHAAVP